LCNQKLTRELGNFVYSTGITKTELKHKNRWASKSSKRSRSDRQKQTTWTD